MVNGALPEAPCRFSTVNGFFDNMAGAALRFPGLDVRMPGDLSRISSLPPRKERRFAPPIKCLETKMNWNRRVPAAAARDLRASPAATT
jgi:hypothetical protein